MTKYILAALWLIAITTTANASLLPAGYLHTSGNQILDQNNNTVRIASVGTCCGNHVDYAPMDFGAINYKTSLDGIKTLGANAIRISWTDAGIVSATTVLSAVNYGLNSELTGLTYLGVLDKIVTYAGTIGLKIILDHHDNEGITAPNGASNGLSCTAQQSNGLWFDSGTGTDNTDGCTHTGTVTAATFQTNTVSLATRYAGNSTVIGFDMDNEPFKTGGTPLNWGGGGATDIKAMYQTVGNAVLVANPGVLIICQGPLYLSGNAITSGMSELQQVGASPVVLTDTTKVVYSPHEYSTHTTGITVDQGTLLYRRLDLAWGYLISQNIAPIWVGEIGTDLPSQDGEIWLTQIVPYLNCLAKATGTKGISTDWWYWTLNSGDGWGPISSYGPPAVVRPTVKYWTDQLL